MGFYVLSLISYCINKTFCMKNIKNVGYKIEIQDIAL